MKPTAVLDASALLAGMVRAPNVDPTLQGGRIMTEDHKDQRAGLIVFGSLGIVAACFCGLFCLLYVAMAAGFMGEAARPSFSIFIQIMGFYGGAGLAFLWLGVGSILCRKWATASSRLALRTVIVALYH